MKNITKAFAILLTLVMLLSIPTIVQAQKITASDGKEFDSWEEYDAYEDAKKAAQRK